MPATVGFITSPTGAAVQDFIRILQRRGWRGRLVVLPAKVQGEGAAAEMIEMLQLAAALGIFDLLVIGRGGGSLEDLWAFNEEPLVRAVAACAVPIISAVGHEIDFTLCDFAADVRAETPSAAAELISSNFLAGAERAARAGRGRWTTRSAAPWSAPASGSTTPAAGCGCCRPQALIEQGYLRLDDLSNRLAARRCAPECRRTGSSSRLRRGATARVRPRPADQPRVAPAALALETPAGGEPGVGAQPRLRDRARRARAGRCRGAPR